MPLVVQKVLCIPYLRVFLCAASIYLLQLDLDS